MKLWSQKRWKKILLLFFLTIFISVSAFSAYVILRINKDVVSGIDVLNTSGSKTALVVYQPGLSSFPRDVTYSFANGLASSGWRVEITTASSQTPSNLSKYSLLVLGFPVYGSVPGAAILRYVERVSNLNGIRTVIIALSAGPNKSIDVMKQKLQAANGAFYQALTLYTMAPNEIGNGVATDIAKQAGSQITP